MRAGNPLAAALVAVALVLTSATAPLAQHKFHTIHGAEPDAEKLDYDALFAAAIPLEESEEGTALLETCLERHGGVDALRRLERLRLTYGMLSFGNPDTIRVEKSFDRGGKYRVSRPGETRTLNGDRGHYDSSRGSLEFGPETGRYRAEYFSYLALAMPLAMVDREFDGGIRFGARDDDPLRYFYLEMLGRLMVVIGVDPANGLIMSAEGVVRQDDQSLVFINRFSDHREVDGYVFPHGLMNISMGLKVGESHLLSVDVNPEFGADHFGPGR